MTHRLNALDRGAGALARGCRWRRSSLTPSSRRRACATVRGWPQSALTLTDRRRFWAPGGLCGLSVRGRAEASPVELTQIYLERIGRLDRAARAYITVLPECALASARRAEAAVMRGETLRSFTAFPMRSRISSIPPPSLRTTSARAILEGHVPTADDDDRAAERGRRHPARQAEPDRIRARRHAAVSVRPAAQSVEHGPRSGWLSSGSGIAVSAALCAASLGRGHRQLRASPRRSAASSGYARPGSTGVASRLVSAELVDGALRGRSATHHRDAAWVLRRSPADPNDPVRRAAHRCRITRSARRRRAGGCASGITRKRAFTFGRTPTAEVREAGIVSRGGARLAGLPSPARRSVRLVSFARRDLHGAGGRRRRRRAAPPLARTRAADPTTRGPAAPTATADALSGPAIQQRAARARAAPRRRC